MINTIVLVITGIGVGYQIKREFEIKRLWFFNRKEQKEKKIPTRINTQPRKANGQFMKKQLYTYTQYRREIGMKGEKNGN